STSSRPSRGFPTASCPLQDANNSGVLPSRSTAVGLISSRSKSILTTPSFPLQDAKNSGVLPSQSAVVGLTSWSRSISTTPSCPLLAAHMSAVPPMPSLAFTLHLFISNKAVNIPEIPKNAAPWSPVKPVNVGPPHQLNLSSRERLEFL
ncbi:hypothetical protein L873DRAFT_1667968, partial [Choiromyces venosus 120613-1]